jgi:hypothetical protein
MLRHLALPITILCVTPCALAQVPGPAQDTGPVVHEKFEWSDIWWDCADDPSLPRVLLIGDSISCGYSRVVTRLLEGRYHVDRLGTSRSLNDPVLAKETVMMLQDSPYAAVHFNNGLHGFHLSPEQYAAGLRQYLALIREHCGDAKLIWGNSTPITVGGDTATLADSNAVVITRNELAAAIMSEAGIPTDGLYGTVIGKPELRSGDGYHYAGDGYEVLGKAVADAVLSAVEPR